MKIGFIGLGIMGKPMVRNLLKAGYEVQAYDIVEASVKAVAESGAIGCASIAEAVRGCPIVITVLPNSPHVKAAVLGEGGVLENAERNALLVDMSSIAPGASIEIHDALSKKGIRMIDAPVSGGEPKAIDGTMAIMVGGDEADFEEALPLFRVMGGSYTLVGPIGSGNTCKLTNQIIVAVNIAALAEGMMLARRAGTDPEKVFEAIRGGLAGSTVMNAKAPMMLANDFPPGTPHRSAHQGSEQRAGDRRAVRLPAAPDGDGAVGVPGAVRKRRRKPRSQRAAEILFRAHRA